METTEEQENQKNGQRAKHNSDLLVHCALIATLLFLGTVSRVNWSVIQKTLIGMLIAGAGGLVMGIAAQRFLANSHTTPEALLGMTITTGIGVLTIGYLYIAYIKGPMARIGTLDRTVEQTFIFLEFLIAQVSGIRLGKAFLR